MSNIALVSVVLGALFVVVVLGARGIVRVVLVAGIAAIALIALLIWYGTLTTSEIKDTVVDSWEDLKEKTVPENQTTKDSSIQPAPVAQEANKSEVLNSLRVVGSVPATCREAAWTLENRAAPREARINAARQLAQHGASFEHKGRPISAAGVLGLFD